ncbi:MULTISPECIES: hypothetical protein [Erwinia]|uniref:hypothetical protein n=1 Tax=Erwinia TaxID=551 RepID=UPI000A7CF27E|nr:MULTISPECIES: hypothetical protein [Erwinia]
MDAKDDKLLALVGLLTACLITIIVMFTLTWISDMRLTSEEATLPEKCIKVDTHVS